MDINTNKGLFQIRPIAPEDNRFLTEIIVNSLLEFGASGDGFACNDPETMDMYEAYQEPGRKYFSLVNAETQEVVGGGGIAPLKGSREICEFVKMYLETLEHMHTARALYEKYEFRQIESPLGCTGHYSCDAFYIREL
ncbi:MAG: GNAT family N-acetyltransferase [Bacteroidota bacterium]|nr:GNAT family N-acetyltransferase [Bacteroidota bacterium]